MTVRTLSTIDLFAGCGGLAEGFEASGDFEMLGAVEWEKAPRDTLVRRMYERWGMKDAGDRILRFDMQDSDRLFSGWKDDPVYGTGAGLDALVGSRGLDVVIGGPPCQAYSVAGRIRDGNGMRDDYRNFLFESYLSVIRRYRPKAFIFENVPGLLSAKPNGGLIAPRIRQAFLEAGWAIPSDLKKTLVDMSEFGIPQVRKRLIILGLSVDVFGDQTEAMHNRFYEDLLPARHAPAKTVGEAIGDLPKLVPLPINDGRTSHASSECLPFTSDHEPRFHNARDVETFRMLADDIKSGRMRYTSAESLKELYSRLTGKTSNIHKYHVLRADKPSNLIPAHLHKDGLRHIHPDPEQARSITVREAARLQGFPDDFEFCGSRGDKYKMIGNAVPPAFARIVADALKELLREHEELLNR